MGGFILLEGPPGSGKSTYLTEYKKHRTNVRFAYYCFVPNEIILGNRRLETDTFLKSLCVGIKNSFPAVDFPEPYSEDYQQKLPRWLDRLSQLGEKVVFVIDGLDHVDKKKDSIRQPLTNYLEGTLPPNVFFLLSSQYPEALAQGIQTQLSQDPRRHIKVERLSEGGTQLFLERRGLNPSLKIVSLARAKSEGLPVYLYYIAILLRDVGSNEYLQEQLLLDLPKLENDEIDTYHEFLYDQVAKDDLALGTLALLAVRREFTSTATLVDLLLILNVQANVINVESTCSRYKHLLRRSDARGYTIFHNSFREFILTKTKALLGRINDALVDYYKANPSLDETYRNFYRHLFELGRYDEILADCDDKWLYRSWRAFRPFEEISANLDIAWDAAAQSLSLAKFVRIAFLEQRFGRASFNFENTEGYSPTNFLLSINKPEEALRRVWDGETVRCSANEFYDFVLDYFEKTGSLLPQRITDVGFEQFERRTNVGETIARFQSRALYTNWHSLFSEAENLRWRSSDDHTQLVTVASQEENAATNNSIKNHVTDLLFRSRDIGSLMEIAKDTSCHASVTNHALLRACEILVDADQAGEAAKYVSSLNFKLIGRADYNRLIIRLAEAKLFNKVADQLPTDSSPPALFEGLIESSPDYRLKKPLLQLYDDLRVCFLVGSADDRVYQLKADSFNPPEHNFFTAIIRLAKLWSNWIHTRVSDQDRFEELKGILSELNLDYESRTRYFKSTDHFTDTFIRREVHKIYAHIFDFASTKLSGPYVSEIVRYWLILDKGRAGYKNQKTTINFAKSLHDDRSDTLRAEILALLKWAESQARTDEETLELLTNLVECAEGYGYCGFDSEAERLWNELYTLACGVHSRKDYQFSEVIGALQNAHKCHPEKSRGRLITLLTLAHQLWGAADERAVARAIGGLIDFACDLSPALAIELLEKEEDSIYRGELIEALTDTLAGNPEIDLRYVWAIVRTMNKWDHFQSYNDDTYPTMLSLFQFCIERKDSTLAEEIYRYVRHQLLVEKEMPGRVGEFAEIAVSKGALFSTVVADRSEYQAEWQEEQQRIARQSGGTLPPTNSRPKKPSFEELHALAENDFDRFEEKLADVAKEHSRAMRAEDLKHSYTTLRDTLSRLITLRPPAQAEIVKKNRLANIRYFVEFKRAVIAAQGENEFGFLAVLRDLFELLVSAVCAPIFGDDWREYVASHFDGPEWLRKFASSLYFRTRSLESEMVGNNLLPLIEQSSIANLGNWEQFCRKHLFGSALTRPLLTISERIKQINKKHSLELLIEAWTQNKDFFYTYGSEATNSFLALLFELDSERAKRTVLEGFSHQYKRFPQEIVYHLDQITEYAEFFGEDDIHEFIYSEYERYNFALVEGLTTKESDFNWIESYPSNSTFATAVIRYLVHMFDYPPVETRKLSLASLFDLIKADPDVLNIAFSFWQEMSHNAKEHLLSLVYSLTLYDYKLVLTHKQRLLDSLQIPHFNIRQTAKEILLFYFSEGGNIEDEELRRIEMINVAPQVLVPSIEEGALQEGTRFIPCSYQTRLLTELTSLNREDDFAAKVYTTLVRRGWTSGSWTENEGIVHRKHNFNTNFDNIEINGPYFTAVQEVLNEIFLKEIAAQNYTSNDIERLKNDFRLFDPADLLWGSQAPHASVDWSGDGLSADDFLKSRDVTARFSDFLTANNDWVVLYEDGHHRTGDLNRTGTTTYFRIVAFLAKKAQLPGLNDSLERGSLRLPYYVCHNRFRHELPAALPESSSYPSSDLKPLLGISENRFRGQNNLSIATLLPDVLEGLQLSRSKPYSLTFNKDGDHAIEWGSWQRAYDQDRRRQQPKAAGVVMTIRKHLLDRYLNNTDYQLCFQVNLRRSVDQYVEESDMRWQRFTRVFW